MLRFGSILLAIALAGCTDALDTQDQGIDLTCDEGRLFIDHSPKGVVTHKQNVSFGFEARDVDVLGAAWIVEGGSVPGANATHAFTTPGMHAVELRVFTADGCVVVEAYEVEIMNKDPVASFTTKVAEDTLVLDARDSSDPNEDALTFIWSVDGTVVEEGELVAIAMPESGAVVGLLVQDPYGGEARDQTVVA